MSHLNPAGVSTAARPPNMFSGPSPERRGAQRRHLDRDGLRSGVATRQREIAEIENDMVAACERAAARGAAHIVRIDDRGTWDRDTWQRYLDAATKLEPEFGPRLRRLYQEIDRLNRLIAMPFAA